VYYVQTSTPWLTMTVPSIFYKNTVNATSYNGSASHRNLWRAILIFEPNSRKYLTIFSHMLFNSWIYILRVELAYRQRHRSNASNIIDLIVVVSDDFNLFNALPPLCTYIGNMSESEKQYLHDKESRSESLCVIIDSNNSLHTDENYYRLLHGNRRTGYPFLNSIDCVISFAEQYPALYYRYDFMLRTDDDVFLTPFFLYAFPNDTHEFVVGKGDYLINDITRQQLLNMSSLLNLTHCTQPKELCFNLGSTWYGSPSLIYRVAQLTFPPMCT